jgi:hypothetical protein
MKHLQLRISLITTLIIVASMFLNSCGDDLEGTFLINEQASIYKTDTTIYSFKMVDSYGITDEFYQSNIWYSTHNYLSGWGDEAWYESYGIAYESSLNNNFFMLVLRGDIDHSDLEVEWNQKDRINFEFGGSGHLSINDNPGLMLSRYDTLSVNGVLYSDILEINILPAAAGGIDKNTPVRTWVSGSIGLIMFERKDGIISKRIP